MRIAGKTAGPIWLNFFVDTHGWPCYNYKNEILFSTGNTAGPSSSYYYIKKDGFQNFFNHLNIHRN